MHRIAEGASPWLEKSITIRKVVEASKATMARRYRSRVRSQKENPPRYASNKKAEGKQIGEKPSKLIRNIWKYWRPLRQKLRIKS